MESRTLVSENRKVWENRFQWFLLPCVLLLLIEFILPGRNGKRRMPVMGLMAFGFMIMLPQVSHAFVFSSVKDGITAFEAQQFDQAKTHFIDAQLEDPDQPELYYNIGTAAYKNQEYELAEKQFLKAMDTSDPGLKHQSEYNLANTWYRMGKLDEAIAGYESVLKSWPEDTKAKENLEFVQKKKEEKEQQKNQEQQEQQEQQKQQDQQKGQDSDSRNSQEPSTEKQSSDGQQPEETQPKDQTSKDQEPDPQPADGQDSRPDDTEPAPQDPMASTGGKDKSGDPGSAAIINETMLNRLQDKPGQALMPVYKSRNIKKDW
jgi:Ca-activated chloride channel family protein